MAAAQTQPETNRGSLEFKITAPATTDHDYIVVTVPDLAPFQCVLDYCAKHFEAKDAKTCVIQTKGKGTACTARVCERACE